MLNLAVIGAGLVGKAHLAAINAVPGARTACIVDPDPRAQEVALAGGAAYYPSLTAMFAAQQIDGAILATPSQMHLEGALACIGHKCPVLVEKPLATTIKDAEQIVSAARDANTPVLTGHHRRHGAILKTVKSLIDDGALGAITSVHVTCWFRKPDDYFDVEWRSKPGGGPVFINTIHDIDALRFLFGAIASVSALTSARTRGGSVEDSAAVVLAFQSGVLATITVSDATVSPWSWELTSGENPGFPATSQASYLIGGTKASLSVPDMMLWCHQRADSWTNPMQAQKIAITKTDPLIAQIQQFAAVIRGQEPPLVSAMDGLQSL
ncbi:MAG TPA: Gfo/Idh/MocA family oxidoreductase, partial [Roseibacterium sp.]|nr:Gfo/Idh/MocA family oxidoreductase [Roseibacterium sp.]